MARVCLDLLAQLPDIDTDGAAVAEVAPDQFEQVVAAEHLTWVLDEQPEDRELLRRELNKAPVDGRLVRREVDLQPAKAMNRTLQRARRPGPSEHRLDPLHDLGRRRRLDHVVVGAEPQTADLVAVLAARAQEENRHAEALAQTPADIEPGLALEHHVEEHAIDAAPTERGYGGRATRGRMHLEAFRLQEIAHEAHDLRLILDEQHPRRAVCARFSHYTSTV